MDVQGGQLVLPVCFMNLVRRSAQNLQQSKGTERRSAAAAAAAAAARVRADWLTGLMACLLSHSRRADIHIPTPTVLSDHRFSLRVLPSLLDTESVFCSDVLED